MSRPLKKRKLYQRFQFGNLKAELDALVDANGEGWIKSLGPQGEWVQKWIDQAIEDLGGPENVTTLRRTQIYIAAKTMILIESADRFIFSMPSIINRSRRQIFPIVPQRNQMVAQFGRLCADIGMERQNAEADQFFEALKARYASLPERRALEDKQEHDA